MTTADAQKLDACLAKFWAKEDCDAAHPEDHVNDGTRAREMERQLDVVIKHLCKVRFTLMRPFARGAARVFMSRPRLSKKFKGQDISTLLEDIYDAGLAVKFAKR